MNEERKVLNRSSRSGLSLVTRNCSVPGGKDGIFSGEEEAWTMCEREFVKAYEMSVPCNRSGERFLVNRWRSMRGGRMSISLMGSWGVEVGSSFGLRRRWLRVGGP